IKGINTNTDLNLYDEKHNVFRNCEAHSKTDASKDVAVTEKYAKECADGADAAVIVITRDSSEGADNSVAKGDFTLNDTEFDMIKRVSEAFHSKGKTVTVLINTGSPIEVVSWRELVDAILFIGYPGQNAGESVAKVLSGEVNPNAKTTMSWPVSYSDTACYRYFPGNSGKTVYYDDIYVGYRFYETFDVKTAYPFGYGLSYTEYEYSDFSVKENKNGTFTATVKVTNKGKAAGREIAQIYVSKPETTLEQPSIELCGFAKTALLQPGEGETLTITITADALYSYDTANSRYIVDKGGYKFYAGSSAEDMHGEAAAEIKELRVIYDVENRCVPSPEPEHIIKAEYKARVSRSDDEAIALTDDTKKSGTSYVVDLKKECEAGQIYMEWVNLSGPIIISTAGEDKSFERYDIFAASGLVIIDENLHGAKCRYIKITPTASSELKTLKVYPADDNDKQYQHTVYENLALKKPVTSATVEGAYYDRYAVDGDFSSRWGSLPTGESWLCVDLGEVKHIKGMLLYLEAAWVPYRVEYSTDGENFTAAASLGSGEVFVKLKDLDFDARYVRFIREGENWFSIYEVEIYG
ncbi:MAG: glycoside hydrolase family 3 C-terminal domain-containing protein, partial [Clostridia bacterium]|nr:glycoside hydrolase family 3 C-terminal domain-containing protein [Clostridia bacterium]